MSINAWDGCFQKFVTNRIFALIVLKQDRVWYVIGMWLRRLCGSEVQCCGAPLARVTPHFLPRNQVRRSTSASGKHFAVSRPKSFVIPAAFNAARKWACHAAKLAGVLSVAPGLSR